MYVACLRWRVGLLATVPALSCWQLFPFPIAIAFFLLVAFPTYCYILLYLSFISSSPPGQAAFSPQLASSNPVDLTATSNGQTLTISGVLFGDVSIKQSVYYNLSGGILSILYSTLPLSMPGRPTQASLGTSGVYMIYIIHTTRTQTLIPAFFSANQYNCVLQVWLCSGQSNQAMSIPTINYDPVASQHVADHYAKDPGASPKVTTGTTYSTLRHLLFAKARPLHWHGDTIGGLLGLVASYLSYADNCAQF